MLGNVSIKKLVVILGIVFIASGVISGIIFFMDYGISGFNIDNLESYEDQVDVEKKADLQGINTIRVECASPDIKVISTNSNELKAHFYGGYSASTKSYKPELIVTRNGGKLLIKIEDNVDGLLFSFRSNLKLDVYIPSQFAESVEAKTASGNIAIEDLTIEKLSLQTSSGDISTGFVKAETTILDSNSGKITFAGEFSELNTKTTSGDISTEFVKAENAIFDTNSGKIKFAGEFSQLNTETTSGDICTGFVKAENAIFDTDSGKIDFAGEFSELNTKTTSGDIISENIEAATSNLKSASGKIAVSGSLTNIVANTASGDISLSSSNQPLSIRLTTNSGKTTLKLPNSAGFKLTSQSISGEISTDFPITVTTTGDKSEHELNGTVGDGNSDVSISSTSGDIRIIN